MRTLKSTVPGFEGECVPIWINDNHVVNRFSNGVTGFFKLVEEKKIFGITFQFKTGKEFHGMVKNGVVVTTEGMWR